MLTINEIKERLKTIKRIAEEDNDDEVAHSREDELYQDVLKAISEGHPNAIELAKLALTSSNITFCRWCA